MTENIPEWITNLALDIYKVVQKHNAMPRFGEMVSTWAEKQEAEGRGLTAWKKRRKSYFEQKVINDPTLQDENKQPEQDWQFEDHFQHLEKKTESGNQYNPRIIHGWVPPELSKSAIPKITHPLPLRKDHQLTIIEKGAILAAVYECGRKGTETLPLLECPDDLDEREELLSFIRSVSFLGLCDAASKIDQSCEGWLRAMLDEIEKDLRKNRPSAKNPIFSKTFLNNLLRASIKHLPYVGSFLYDVIYGTVDQPQTELPLHSTTGDNVETEPDTKSEREEMTVVHKPWYKKTWIIIVGLVTVLTGLSASVYICESETGKHFINSFKRKPSISVDYRRTKLYARTKKRVDDFYESIRNEKLDTWLFTNVEGVKNQATKYNGDIIYINGAFSGSKRLIFWSDDFIPPFIENAIIKVFDQTIDECRKNGLDPEIYVYEAKRILSDFIYKIYNRMADMDQKLLKQVHPENSGRRDVTREIEKMCKCLDEHYNAALLLSSGNKN